jgi:hypothetical protein
VDHVPYSSLQRHIRLPDISDTFAVAPSLSNSISSRMHDHRDESDQSQAAKLQSSNSFKLLLHLNVITSIELVLCITSIGLVLCISVLKCCLTVGVE